MIEQVAVVSYGREASLALAAAVARAKSTGGPLAPVTVIVASNVAGLSLRHLLGSGHLGIAGGANVSFLTPFDLVGLLGADLLPGSRPLTNPVLGSAVRLALADDPGPFRDVAEHVATETAVAALFGELSNVDPTTLDTLEATGAGVSALIGLYRRVLRHLGGFHTEADLAAAVVVRADLADALVPLGTVIWFTPEPTTAPMARLLRAVVHAAPSVAIVALTGDVDTDAAVRTMCQQVGIDLPTDLAPPAPPTADRIVSVTDADEEVRAVVRAVAALADQGVALNRMAVFHPTTDPYATMLAQQLEAAAIPFNGPSNRRLSDTVSGRTLLRSLHLPGQRWRRDRVMALVAGAPIGPAGDAGPARPATWENLSRAAGVVADLHDWKLKLDAHRRVLTRRRRTLDGEEQSGRIVDHRRESLDRDLDDVDHLDTFVSGLAAEVTAVDKAVGWAAKADAASALLRSLLGDGSRHTGWPEGEQDAFERVEAALVRLAALEALEPTPTHDVFLRALESELDAPRGRVGRYGVGVYRGPLASAVGQDFDAVFIVGCAEGLLPVGRRDDTMIPDATRELTDGQLDLRRNRLHQQHRAYLAALACAPEGRRTLTFPRGDLRANRETLPSRWLLDSAGALNGAPVYATDFDALSADVVTEVASFASGLRTTPVFASVAERDLAALAAHPALPTEAHELADHPIAAPIAQSIRALQARRSDQFTEWDGNLEGQPIASTADRPLSATRLESWASCGYRYFLAHVLELADRDDPERVTTINPLDKGSAVHQVLEEFFAEVIALGPPAPETPWSPEQRARLREIANRVFDDFESRGRTGRTVLWDLTRSELLAGLQVFLDRDDEFRAANDATPESVELPFGLEDAPPVRLTLADGRTLAFRGLADRVDRTSTGTHIVSDYKTGKGDKYSHLEDDPLAAGTTLQLGLYSEAAVQLLGAGKTQAAYWMVEAKGGFMRYGYPWTDDVRTRFVEVLTAMADGIEGGVFPSVPGEWDSWRSTYGNCAYCEFDSVCSSDREEQASAKVAAPQLRIRDVLEPEPDGTSAAIP